MWGEREGEHRVTDSAMGARLRSARRARRSTLDEVAARSGLTKGFISKLERGRSSASMASLLRLCDALQLSLADLLTDTVVGDLVRQDGYPSVSLGGQAMREFALTPAGELRMQALLSVIEPRGGSGNEMYSLPCEVGFLYVISGSLEIAFEGRAVALGEGDAFTFAPNEPHSFVNSGSDVARLLWILVPALTAERPPVQGSIRRPAGH